MIHWDEVEFYYKPREIILSQLPYIPNEPEMSKNDSAFLCGLLKKYDPHKVVEVGVAGGGTTAVIMQCLEELSEDMHEIYSVDINDRFYMDPKLKCGYLGDKALDIIKPKHIKHRFLLGKIACEYEDVIGDNVDCLILDAAHYLPGEVLDFISLLPQLKEDALVILHDVSLNFYGRSANCATGVLLSSVCADKYMNHDPNVKNGQYPNIAAFVINAATRESIENVFLALSISWYYMFPDKIMNAYLKSIKKHYKKELVELFDTICFMNRNSYIEQKLKYKFPFELICRDENIIIYGAGRVGQDYVKQIVASGYCNIKKWVDRNYKEMSVYRIECPEEIFNAEYDKVVISVESKNTSNEIMDWLVERGVEKEKIIWNIL